MSIVFLYHSEDSDFGGTLSAASGPIISLLDQYCYMFGYEHAAVHPDLPPEDDYPCWSPTKFKTMEEAQEAYRDREWIILDPNADLYLDEHPLHFDKDVVYVVGHDDTGYGDTNMSGTRVKLRVQPENFEGHAVPCLMAALCDRWSREWQ